MSRLCLLLFFVCCTANAQVVSRGIVRGGTFWGGLPRVVTASNPEVGDSITNNMIACWPLDEATATREDDWATFDLTDNNTVTGTTGPTGLGNASLFDAANSEYLSRADHADLRMGNFSTTFVIWANQSVTGFRGIIGKDTGGSRGYFLYHTDAIANTFVWQVYDTTGSFGQIISSGTFPEGSGWHFIICGYDEPNNRLFMSVDNGTMEFDAMPNPPNASTAEFQIGHDNSAAGAGYYAGALAGAALWNRLLTAVERETLYNGGAGQRACEEQGN